MALSTIIVVFAVFNILDLVTTFLLLFSLIIDYMQSIFFRLIAILGGFYLLIQLSSCDKNNFITTPGAGLQFQLDTITFDTVFTQLGSATKWVKVYNPHNQPIKLSKVYLGGGSTSDFKINIDGFSGDNTSNVEIPAKDSIYIFAKVFIDPNNGDAIREDSIMFETPGGGTQRVILNAYGWNATYIGKIGFETRVTTDITLTPNQPYIFMGLVRFMDACLTIQGGTEIFMYGGPSTAPGTRAVIYIDSNSCIKSNVNGTLANPVEIKTHRLEPIYQLIAFHHQGIVLSNYSRDNQIHGTIIRNAVDGIQIEGGSINGNRKLEIKNSYIYNVDRAGILAIRSDILAENTVIANSNQYNFVSIYGGTYDFNHCTFANYGAGQGVHSEPILSLRDFYIDADKVVFTNTDPSHARFTNSIIYGTKREETEILYGNGANPSFDVFFDYCLMKSDTFNTGIRGTSIKNQDPLFVDTEEFDYSIDSIDSPANNAGIPIGIFQDAEGAMRSGGNPSLGAYEIDG